ncbi:MAG: STAS domain-containing protein [Clostridia bacterium]|nr:STAS domain-containing protein [Clostridia bacterium]
MSIGSAQLKTECNGGVLTAYVSGEIDHHTSKELRNKIDACLGELSPDKLTIDLSGVTFMDSSGLGLIMGRFRLTESAHINFSVKGVPPRAAQMFSMAGLERIIDFEQEK